MATKKEARERKTKWNRAISEGRMVRYTFTDGTQTFSEFRTPMGAVKAVENAEGTFLAANIVDPTSAEESR